MIDFVIIVLLITAGGIASKIAFEWGHLRGQKQAWQQIRVDMIEWHNSRNAVDQENANKQHKLIDGMIAKFNEEGGFSVN
jgi:hypothetical protein